MKRKLTLLLVGAIVITLLTGCNSTPTTEEQVNNLHGNEDLVSGVVKDEIDVESDIEDTEENTEDKSDQTEESISNEQITTDWIDFENIQFVVKGNVYTLGESTLQDMIDDGVPFDESDIVNASNNVKPNYRSDGFEIVLGEYWSAVVYVANYTEGNAKASDLPITQVYFPNKFDKTQNVISFAFPLTITEMELVKQCGEPTEKDEYVSDDSDYFSNKYEYKRESTKYYGDWGYKFEFQKEGLAYLTIEWMP